MSIVTRIKEQTIPLPAQVRKLIDWHDGDLVTLEVMDRQTLTITLSNVWSPLSLHPVEQRKKERLAHHRQKAGKRDWPAKDDAYYAAMAPEIEELTHEFSVLADQAFDAYETYLEDAE